MQKLWTEFRVAADGLYPSLAFRDEETSNVIVAQRLTVISDALASSELPNAPAGVGGGE
jgi:hypothetical protein